MIASEAYTRGVSSEDARGRRASRIALGFLVAVWLSYAFPMFTGKVLFPIDLAHERLAPRERNPLHNPLESDAFDQQHPWRQYLGRRLARGELPLWDPYRFAGTPFAANSQTAVWYPPNWLYVAGDTVRVYTVVQMLSILAALGFMYWFLRLLGLHPFSAAAGAAVFAGSGFLVAWRMHTTFVSSGIWLPAALAGLELAWTGRARWGVPLAALALALSVLGGQAQVALFVWTIATLWTGAAALAAAIARRGEGLRVLFAPLWTVGLFGVAAALAAGLSALQILSSDEISRFIMRSMEAYDAVIRSSVFPENLMTFFVPDLLGNPVDGFFIGRVNYTESALYVGLVPLVLALAAVLYRRDRATLAFALIAFVGALCAFGTPIYRLLYELVPRLDQTRAIARFVYWVDFGLAGLAAAGLETLRAGRARRMVGAGTGAMAAAVVAVALYRGDELPPGYLGPKIALALVLLAIAGGCVLLLRRYRGASFLWLLILSLMAADLWVFGFRYHRFQSPSVPYPRTLQVEALRRPDVTRARFASLEEDWLPPNAGLVYSLYYLGGYDTFILRSFVELVSLAEDQRARAFSINLVGPWQPPAAGSPVMDLLGVHDVLGRVGALPGEPRHVGRFAIYPRQESLPPVFLASCWEVVPENRVLDRLRGMGQNDLATTAILAAGPSSRLSPPGGVCSHRPAEVSVYEPERVIVRVHSEEGGVLVGTDAWFPGWRVRVDGEPRPLLRVDHALRGVWLPGGPHEVAFEFRPQWLERGAAVTLAALLLLAGWAIGYERVVRRLQ